MNLRRSIVKLRIQVMLALEGRCSANPAELASLCEDAELARVEEACAALVEQGWIEPVEAIAPDGPPGQHYRPVPGAVQECHDLAFAAQRGGRRPRRRHGRAAR